MKKTAAFSLLLAGLLSLAGWASAADNGTELFADDDLTIYGSQGSALDPDVEIKGFSVFGSTQTTYGSIPAAPGNVVVNGVLSVSSGAYFVRGSTFSTVGGPGTFFFSSATFAGPGGIFVPGGAVNQVLIKSAGGAMQWSSLSALSGDALGTHVATTTLSMGVYGIVTSSFVTAGAVNSGKYLIAGSTILAALGGTGSLGLGENSGRTSVGDYNTFLGEDSGYNNQTGFNNAVVGARAGFGGAGSYSGNSIVGYRAGYALTTGSSNTLLGMSAGDSLTTGGGNILIGAGVDTQAPGDSYKLNIGSAIYGDLATGRIGIGTTTFSAKLTVASTANAISDKGLYSVTRAAVTGTSVTLNGSLSAVTGQLSDGFGGGLNHYGLAGYIGTSRNSAGVVGAVSYNDNAVGAWGALGYRDNSAGANEWAGYFEGPIRVSGSGVVCDINRPGGLVWDGANFKGCDGGGWRTFDNSGGWTNTGAVSYLADISDDASVGIGTPNNAKFESVDFIDAGGSGLGHAQMRSALKGYAYAASARTFKAGVSGYVDSVFLSNSAGVIGASSNSNNPSVWGALGYIDGGSVHWAGYFSGNVKSTGTVTIDTDQQPNALVTRGLIISTSGAVQTTGTGLGVSGGGLRGTGAVDLQIYRVSAFQVAGGSMSVIGGGASNQAGYFLSVVGGGGSNVSTHTATYIGGGLDNQAGNMYAAVAGGNGNRAHGNNAFIGGGGGNRIGGTSNFTVIAGGSGNTIGSGNGSYGFIGGGYMNEILANSMSGTIAGGYVNKAGASAFVGGGDYNQAIGDSSVISGGGYNYASGQYSAVPGGYYNSAAGSYSFAAGYRSSSTVTGAFTWADSEGLVVLNNVIDQARFKVRGGFWVSTSTVYDSVGLFVSADNDVGIGTRLPSSRLEVVGTTADAYVVKVSTPAAPPMFQISTTGFVSASHWMQGGCKNPFDPADIMVPVGDLCVDKYEASVWNAPVAGTQVGLSYGTYPCAYTGNDCTAIYARSVVGVQPNRFISYFQALAACRNAGKHLLTNAEWQAAALGTPDSGASSPPNCNTVYGSPQNTGSGSSCLSAAGAENMIGSVSEWVSDWYVGISTKPFVLDSSFNGDKLWETGASTATVSGIRRGGDFTDGTNAGVFAFNNNIEPWYTMNGSLQYTGFRCGRRR